MRRKREIDQQWNYEKWEHMQVCPGSKINFLPHLPMVDEMRAFTSHKYFLMTMKLYLPLFFFYLKLYFFSPKQWNYFAVFKFF